MGSYQAQGIYRVVTDTPLTLGDWERVERAVSGGNALGPPERALLAFFLDTGAHPITVADPEGHMLGVDGGWYRYRRAKTRAWARTPIPSRPGLPVWDLMKEWWGVAPYNLFYAVRTLGKAIGVPTLSPRGERHTFILRTLYWVDWDFVRAEGRTGTDWTTLLNYARTRREEFHQGRMSIPGPPLLAPDSNTSAP